MVRLLPVLALMMALLFQAPAFAAEVPPLAEALSSARVGAGNVITDGSGQPVYDGSGQPLRVTGIETTTASQTVASLAAALRVPVADLLSYANRLGMTLPIVMPVSVTTVTRSDGGVEQIVVFKANGSEYAFMADKTGSNVFGIRMANVDASGMGRILTAHGLNGNFTNPPWYLSAEAKKDYWMAWGQEQIFQPPTPVAKAPSMMGATGFGAASKRGSVRVGDYGVLNSGQRAIMTDSAARAGSR
ncbi:hypothetical protein D3C87_933090 [compost metagenome]